MMNESSQRLALAILGLLGVSAIQGAIVLAWAGKDVPQPLTALGGVCAGALATYLAITRGKNGGNGQH